MSAENSEKCISKKKSSSNSYTTDALARSYMALSNIIVRSNREEYSKKQLLQLMVRISSAEMDSVFAGVLENSAAQSVSSFFDSFYNIGDAIDGRNN